MTSFAVCSMRVLFIVSFATTLGIFVTDLQTLFTSTLQNDINQLFTGCVNDTNSTAAVSTRPSTTTLPRPPSR